jgi:predicted deacylase
MRNLDTKELSGRVTAIPIACLSSFWDRTPFVTPEDGKNLNRVFPGRARGTFAEKLAFNLFERLILGSDYLLHLHGGAAMELIEPFVGYDTSPEADVTPSTEEISRAMALAYGFPYVLQTERVGSKGTPTMLRTAAAEAGIPSLLAEAGDKGLVDPDAVHQHVAGITRVMERLAMLPGRRDAAEGEWHLVNSLIIERSRHDGWWAATVSIGEQVKKRAKIGVLEDLFGNEIEPVTASADGVCLVLTTSPATRAGSTLAVIGAGIERLETQTAT